ncbi:MAG: RNA-binding cell elongation regulator Jag/EloR [Chloroflexota bacterium]
MSESRIIEATGPDIEAAITKGITELGLTRSDVIVEVLEEASHGLFGLGAHPARVRLTIIRAPRTAAASSVPVAPAPSASASVAAPATATSNAAVPASNPVPPAAAPPDKPRPQQLDDDWTADSFSLEDLAEDARVGAETLQELLGYLKMDAKVVAHPTDSEDDEAQHWTLEIEGRELGALIGRRGETLAALQYITRLLASRDLERRVNIVIDVEGYKARRETMLRRLAKRMAEQAIQRGRPVILEPMPPHERRIIHLTLRDNPNVTTESVGDGDRRKVTIVPRHSH